MGTTVETFGSPFWPSGSDFFKPVAEGYEISPNRRAKPPEQSRGHAATKTRSNPQDQYWRSGSIGTTHQIRYT